ncbi:hydantoinase B/oxoprolinase family protein [Streptomyces sp. NPDC048425]|uniref:hydantoinase B/oxoprolinase family protein n=1 Tax=Streptomyces sp. NPDC048425 TaxID=3365548 RepID=UPI00371ED755
MTVTTPVKETELLLRNLTDEQFQERYGCGRFTASVLSNRLRYSAQHVATGLLHRAFSPIIALAYDFATAICAPPEQNYSMSAVSSGLSVFLGTVSDGVRAAVEEYGVDRLVPGDLLICNDPSRMGNHPNDVCFIRPVFHDGRIAAFMVLRAHQIDIGGTVPGSFSGSKRNVYENGLVISPRLLFHADEPVRETFSMIFDNVRYGELLLPDFKTIASCCKLGEKLIHETIDRYGLEAYLGSMRYACDASQETMRHAIATLPDGDYEASDSLDADGIDATEEYTVDLLLRKRGTRVEVDFSGSSRQARTCINASALDAKTAVGVTLKMLLDPEGDFTSGTFRDIDIVIPPGTIASALPPDGAIFAYWEVEALVLTALLRALEGALGDRAIAGDLGSTNVHNAYGVRPDGTRWACSAMAGGEFGPWGASNAGDADGAACNYLLNIMSPSTEALEVDFPLMITRREYSADSGGAGLNRGGASIARDIHYRQEAQHESMPLRFRRPSGIGVNGGRDGAPGGVWIFGKDGAPTSGPDIFVGSDPSVYADARAVAGTLDPDSLVPDTDGRYFYYCDNRVWSTAAGATWRYVTNGGGGWGDPLQRDPELVKRDVRDGYVTIAGAERDFGVVITGDPHGDPEGLVIDIEATAARRAS